MPSNFPGGLDNFTNPTPADNLNTPLVLHSDEHSNANDAIEALEHWVGISGSNEPASLEYRLNHIVFSAGGGGVMVWDEGVPLGTGFVLNFVGDAVYATISGAVVQILITGSIGPQGPIGPSGSQGIQGPAGPSGSPGIQGPIGPSGSPGSQGPEGATGSQGPQGIQGIQGPTGATGPQGPQGIEGATGATGPQGLQGIPGPTGAQGPQGIQGPTGSQGPQGIQGIQGVQGDPGPSGSPGSTGPQGPTGSQGPQGVAGPSGSPGSQGVQGPPGPAGAGVMVWDEGIPLATGTIFNFRGADVQATISGSVVDIYVSGSSQGATSNIYFLTSGSAGIGSYDLMTVSFPTGNFSFYQSAISATGTIIQTWITESGQPNTAFISDGIYHLHVHATRTAGTQATKLLYQLFKRTSGGVETLLVTSELSPAIPTSEQEFDLETFFGEQQLDTTDRLLVKIYGVPSGGGSTPTIQLKAEGNTLSRFEIPAIAPSSSSIQVQDEGILRGNATIFNFVGDAVVATISGSIAQIMITGSIGPQGPQGIQGPSGSPGPQGIQGPTGSQGVQGIQGPTGSQGPQGIQGPSGSPGSTGPTGPSGSPGSTGPQGPSGSPGSPGAPGANGAFGVFGRNNGTNLGTGTTIDWGIGEGVSISGTIIFVHPFDNGTIGYVWTRGTGSVGWYPDYYNIQWFIGDGTNAIATGSTSAGIPYVDVPTDSVIESWSVVGDVTGSIVTDILKSTFAGFPPTSPLAGLGQPLMTNKRTNNANASGTATILKTDQLLLSVASVSTVKNVTVSLRCRKVPTS